MASPKSVKDPSTVAPAAPDPATEAMKTDPVEVSKAKAAKLEAQATKPDAQKAKPFKPPEEGEADEEELSWIEIELVGEDDKPIPGEEYRITMPDDTVKSGTLDDKGLARVERIKKGTCKVTFPGLDKDAWEKV